MEQTLLEFAKELATRAEEIGRLKSELSMKDSIISGLVAQLSLSTCNCGNSTSSEKLKNHVHAVEVEIPNEDVMTISPKAVVEEVSPVVEAVEETPKKKMGRPKGSKNSISKKSVTPSEKEEKTLAGGSVFKEFLPLDIDNLMGRNTSAYMSDKKDTRAEVLAAV